MISTYTTKLGQYFDVYGGVDLRYYKGKHYNELVDLYGGEYFIDPSRKNVKYKADDKDWQEEHLQKGDIIFLAGTEIRSMGFILSGRVEISRDDFWGNRQVLGHGETGELFGEAYACMPGEVLMVNVVAAEKSRILFLDLGRILNVCTPACSHHNRLIHNLLYIMAKKNLMLTRKIDHMGQRSIREKVMAYLSFESEKQKKKTFGIPFNRQQLADYLAVDRSALSAELSRMKKDGLIEFEKNLFTLL